MRLIVLVALVVLSRALLPQTPPLHSGHLVLNVDPASPIPAVALRLTRDAADGFNLALDVSNFAFTPESVNTANEPNTGHAHLYINGQKIARLYGPWIHLPGKLWPAELNRVKVLLNANASVFAGHNSLVPNESRLTKPVVEDLAVTSEVSPASVLVIGPEYGDAHYLAAVMEVTGRWRHADREAEFHLSERVGR